MLSLDKASSEQVKAKGETYLINLYKKMLLESLILLLKAQFQVLTIQPGEALQEEDKFSIAAEIREIGRTVKTTRKVERIC